MKITTHLTRFSCLMLGAACLLASPARAQDIDPYSLYKDKLEAQAPAASQDEAPLAQGETLETPSETPEAIEEDGDEENIAALKETQIEDTTTTAINAKTDVILPPKQDPLPKLAKLKHVRTDIAPFYLTAREYLALRGNETNPQTRLTYSVVTKPLSADGNDDTREFKPQEIILTLGADFVMMTRDIEKGGLEKTIYDFRFNRLLRISDPSQDGAHPAFTNSSLYATAHSNTRLIANATNKGALNTISGGPNGDIDAFWLESAMSWSMNDRLKDLHTQTLEEGTLITYKEQPIAKYRLDKTPYSDPSHSDAFLAFAHHKLPLHPSVLRQFYAAPAPVKNLTVTAITPQTPEGSLQIWTLEQVVTNPGVFPLPQDALSDLSGPMAFIINEAARGRALGGPPNLDALTDEIETAINAKDWTQAWLTGQRYMAYSKPCGAADERGACTVLSAIESREDLPEDLTALISGFKAAKSSKTRVRALQALKPWAQKDDAPAIITRTIGVTRAKINAVTAKAAGLEMIDASPLINRALAQDPYDPHSYLGLAQFYAANGNYEAAWDVYDALRVSILSDPKAKIPVERAEAKLQNRAPGYFMLSAIAERP
ncbi:MAG: tetratricopeptide repeat protein [Robiginitomaculum sp.]